MALHKGVLSDGTPYRLGDPAWWVECGPALAKSGRRPDDPLRAAVEANLRDVIPRVGTTTRAALRIAADRGQENMTVIGGRVFDAALILSAMDACGWGGPLTPLAVFVGEVDLTGKPSGWVVRFERPDGARLAVAAMQHSIPSTLDVT